MTSTTYVLAIDAGTTNLTVVLFDDRGKEIESLISPVVYHQEGLKYELDMNLLWNNLAQTIKKLLTTTNIPSEKVKIVGLAAQGEGCWLIDEQNEPVRNAILWLDKRAFQLVENMDDRTKERFKELTYSTPVPGTTAILLKWLSENEKGSLEKASHCLNCKDWLRLKLTGKVATDFSDASTSLLNLETKEVSNETFELLGIEEYVGLIPQPKYATEQGGTITKEVAELTGLLEGTIVTMGTLDIVANTIGTGAIQNGDVSTTIGTTCSNQIVLNQLPFDANQPGSIELCAEPGKYLQIIASMAGTLNIDWLITQFFETERSEMKDDQRFFAFLDDKMKAVTPGSDGIIYHPYILGGERAPFYNPHATAQFFGMNMNTDKYHLGRAVYEGIAYSIKDCLSHIPDLKRIILGGGAAKSELLQQIIADCVGVPVVTIEGNEHTAKGAFIVASVLAGIYGSIEEAIDKTIQSKHVSIPIPENSARYNQLFMLYKIIQLQNEENWKLRHEYLKFTNVKGVVV